MASGGPAGSAVAYCGIQSMKNQFEFRTLFFVPRRAPFDLPLNSSYETLLNMPFRVILSVKILPGETNLAITLADSGIDMAELCSTGLRSGYLVPNKSCAVQIHSNDEQCIWEPGDERGTKIIGYLKRDQLEPSGSSEARRQKDLDKKCGEFVDLRTERYVGKSKFENVEIADSEDDGAVKNAEGEDRGGQRLAQ
mmetsp:Transcript_49698/g.159866  ORF Transcript_49698/g.159866 Transcript_49698/m.159866 type:complete len:195 (+) Transcript_49698:62-646(+)